MTHWGEEDAENDMSWLPPLIFGIVAVLSLITLALVWEQ